MCLSRTTCTGVPPIIVLLAAVSGGVSGSYSMAVYFPVRFRLLVSIKSTPSH